MEKLEKKYHKIKDKYKFQGLTISVENPAGSVRHWYDPHNDEHGSTKMLYDYGYLTYSDTDDSGDDEKLDAMIGPDDTSDKVYVIHQMKRPDFKTEDELKIYFGFETMKQCRAAYLHHYNDDRFWGHAEEMTVPEFKQKYVSKSLFKNIGNQVQQNALTNPNSNNLVQQNALDPMFQIDPYDMNNPDSVQMQLRQIGSIKDKELVKLAKVVWGDGYEYKGVDESYVRSELCGFLLDQKELLDLLNPMYAEMISGQGLPTPTQLPHSSNLQTTSPNGQSNSIDQSNSMNSNNAGSTQTGSNYSNSTESLESQKKNLWN
jgi:hypothetical protein